MKTKLLLVFCASIILFAGCAKEDENDLMARNKSTVHQSSSQTASFSKEEQQLLTRLQEINDSLKSESTNTPTEITRSSVDWGAVVKADARGAKEGFSYGWKNGRGFFGKFSSAICTSAIYAVAYSSRCIYEMLKRQPNPGVIEHLRYSLNDVTKAIAVSWDSADLNSRVAWAKKQLSRTFRTKHR